MEIIKVPLSQLTPDPQNAKDHPQDQVEQIKSSILQFGNLDPIGIWGEENLIVEGHGRFQALSELGYEEAECIRLDKLSEEERKAYALVHNQTTMNSGWIDEMLKVNLEQIDSIDMSQFGFVPAYDEDIEIEEDDFELPDEPEHEPTVKRGEIYQLGRHRLMCGDSTNKSDVLRLVDGALMDLVVTDPPYNVAIKNSQGMTIENDDMASNEFNDFLTSAFECMSEVLKPGGSFYVWYASREHINFESALNKAGFTVREQLIWVKNSFILGRSDYHWRHEPCLYGWKDGAAHYFIDDRRQSTVLEKPIDVDSLSEAECRKLLSRFFNEDVTRTTILHEDKPPVNDIHPTMKPLRLISRQVINSSKPNDKVLDLFGGSGSTLISCEQLNRSCFMMEYDPRYAEAIINRWEETTGRKAEKIN